MKKKPKIYSHNFHAINYNFTIAFWHLQCIVIEMETNGTYKNKKYIFVNLYESLFM